MDAERWDRLERIFARGRELPAGSREDFVAQACGVDDALRADVLSLLRADESSSEFMAEPAMDRLASVFKPQSWSLRAGERIGAYTILGLSLIHI